MIVALQIPSDINLRSFSDFLQQSGVVHRIAEEGVDQLVLVNSEDDRLKVIHFYGQLSSGELVLHDHPGSPSSASSIATRLLANLSRFPLTMALLLVNVLLFPVTLSVSEGDYSGLFAQMTLLDFAVRGDGIYFSDLSYTLESHQYWRLLTPMFVHFGWVHIVFNLLWVWEIGRRIELISGSSVLLLVTIVSSLAANLFQYALAGPGFFGGMSGVIFGYLGHSLIWDRLVPDRSMGLRPGIYIFMLVFLVLGFTGAIDLLGMGSLANGAHLGGLRGGLLTGVVAGLLQRLAARPA